MIRGTGPAIYGPTSQATAHFPAGVTLQIEDWTAYQHEASVENEAASNIMKAQAYRNIGLPVPLDLQAALGTPAAPPPPPATPPPATPPAADFFSSIPTWVKWTAGAGIGLLLFRK